MSTHSANGLDVYVHGSELTILMTRLMVHHVNMMKNSTKSTLQTVEQGVVSSTPYAFF